MTATAVRSRKQKRKARKSRLIEKSDGTRVFTFDGFERFELDKERWCAKVLRACKAQNWKPAHLAEWSGVCEATVRALLSGERRFPRSDTLWRIAEALGIVGPFSH